MIDIEFLGNDTKSEWASDAHADVQSAIDILDSLRLAGSLSQDHFQNVCYFLRSAQVAQCARAYDGRTREMKEVVVFMGAGSFVADSYTVAEREANIWFAKHPDAVLLASHANMAVNEKWTEYAITLIVEVPEPRPTVVCLCGSTRFSEAFHEANLRETLAGNIVLSIGCDFKSDTDLLLAGALTPNDKARLDELHLRKIDLADEVLILNVDGYVGESTRREIAYARNHGKCVRWLEVPDGQPE